MKLANLLTSILLLTSSAQAVTLSNAVQQAKSAVGNQTAAIRDYLSEPVAWSTNTVNVITTNDVSEVALRNYLRNNAPAGINSGSNPLQVRAAWSNAVAAATTANKPLVLSEQSIWVTAWYALKTLDDLPSFTTNSVIVVTTTQRRWQALSLARQPSGSEIEAAQR